jgi:DNA-directed RNA polymerase specialized sigma24 family protein
VLSLDTLKVSETSEGDSLFLIDILSIDEDPDSKYLIEICLDKLREKDQQIVIDILDGYTQEEVADKYSVSQATVSRRLLRFKNLIDKEKNEDAQT